jgi:hypothetical protein
MAFPTSVSTLAAAIGSQFLNTAFGGSVKMSEGLNDILTDLKAACTKIGISESSAQDSPVANTVLGSSTTGKSKWRQIVNADVASAAAIAYSKLNLATSILNADIATAAAIAVSKLAAGAANSVLTSNGTTNSFSAAPVVTSLGATSYLAAASKIFIGNSNGTGPYLTLPVASVTVTSGNSALVAVGTAYGFLFVIDASTGRHAIFEIASGNNVSFLLAGDNTLFSVAAPAADNKIHCIYSAGNYYLYNGYGVSHVLVAIHLGIG